MDTEKTSFSYLIFLIYIFIVCTEMVQTNEISTLSPTRTEARNLNGHVFWDDRYRMFRLNLTWEQPFDTDGLYTYNLIYACDPSPCKSNHANEIELVSKDMKSIILPHLESKPKASWPSMDFISLNSNIHVTLESYFVDAVKNSKTVLLFKVPVCVDKLCDCSHMNTLPKPNIQAFVVANDQINVTWSTPYKILEKNDSRYDIIHVYINLFNVTKIKHLVYNTTRTLQLEEIDVMHSTLLNRTVPQTENYQIVLHLEDNGGCRSSPAITNVTKYYLDADDHSSILINGRFILYSNLSYASIAFCILLVTGLISWNIIRNRKYCIERICKKSPRRTGLSQQNSSLCVTGYSQLLKLNHISIPMGANAVYISQDTKPIIAETNDNFEIDIKYLQFLNQIGRGEFGIVYKAFLRMPSSTENVVVAVKTLTNLASLDEITEFTKEIRMLKQVGYHPNIIQLIGYCTKQEPYCMIMEYLENGDLRTYLRKLKADFLKTVQNKVYYVQPNKKSTRFNFSRTEIDKIGRHSMGSNNSTLASESSTYTSERPSTETEYIVLSNDGSPVTPISVFGTPKEIVEPSLNNEELQKFALQIAQGMAHLERKNIVHRDLAARNILIDNDKNLKISDFGLSRKGTYICTKSKLPFRWLSIEALQNQIFTNKSDVWSFGIVLWEIGTLGDCPYSKMDNYLQILKFLIEGHRLEKPTSLNSEIYDIMLKCWAECADVRPTFEELVDILHSMNKKKTYITFENIKHDFFMQTLVTNGEKMEKNTK